jgi:hypothetical protein
MHPLKTSSQRHPVAQPRSGSQYLKQRPLLSGTQIGRLRLQLQVPPQPFDPQVVPSQVGTQGVGVGVGEFVGVLVLVGVVVGTQVPSWQSWPTSSHERQTWSDPQTWQA